MLTKRPAARWFAVGLVVVCTLTIAIVARQLRAASRWLHPDRTHVTAADRVDAEKRLGATLDLTMVTSDKITLRGWYVPSKNRAAVAFVHGKSGNRTSYIAEAEALARAGFGVLLYDARASGESDGELYTWGDREQKDVAAAVDYLASRAEVDPSRIGLQGGSVGATTVALFAANDKRPRAVILNATWTSLEDNIDGHFGQRFGILAAPVVWKFRNAGVDVDAVRPIDRVAEISPRPLLIITGDSDTDTPLPIMQRVFDRAKEPKSFWAVKGAGHGDYAAVAGDEYLGRVVAFFRDALVDAR